MPIFRVNLLETGGFYFNEQDYRGCNQKGGVAKTSTVRNLSYSLAELGKKVLTVDLDPQSNLTIGFGIIPKKAKHTTGTLITRMLTEEELPEKSEYIHSVGKVDILPASRALTVAEVNMLITPGSNKYLSKLLQPLREDYDYILIDTNPSLGALTINALTACDEVLIPIDPELFAITGLNDLMDSIGKVKANLNPAIEIGGILFVKCITRTNLYKTARQNITEYFPTVPIFNSVIPLTVKVGEANNASMAVAEFENTNSAAVAYMELAKEVTKYGKDETSDKIA